MDRYFDFLKKINNVDCKVLKDEPLKKHTSFKIGGPADLFIDIQTEKALIDILKLLNEYDIKFFMLGNGSNVLVSDKGFRGAAIKLSGEFNKIKFLDKNVLLCGSGVLISNFCIFTRDNSLKNAEFLWGIPGTIGGALYMNAGAHGGEMEHIVSSCSYVDYKGQKFSKNKDDLGFSYRSSRFMNSKDIITSVTFELEPGNFEDIDLKMKELLEKRKSKQPLNYPNAGSTFKRPVGNFAGKLIEYCGLKGKSIGGAMISEKHAGFVVNTGNASFNDVIELIHLVQDVVYKKTNIFLECEVRILD